MTSVTFWPAPGSRFGAGSFEAFSALNSNANGSTPSARATPGSTPKMASVRQRKPHRREYRLEPTIAAPAPATGSMGESAKLAQFLIPERPTLPLRDYSAFLTFLLASLLGGGGSTPCNRNVVTARVFRSMTRMRWALV